MKNKKIILLFGPPGCGKGTQAKLLAEKIGLPAISTGALLRFEQSKKTTVGKKIDLAVKNGRLVSDRLINSLLAKRLDQVDAKFGAILDGYPRSEGQLKFLLRYMAPDEEIYPIDIEVSKKEVRRRLGGRRVCYNCGADYHIIYKKPKKAGICDRCGQPIIKRLDDQVKVINRRLAHYFSTIKPIVDYARHRKIKQIIKINGEQSIAQVHAQILKKIKPIFN